MPPQLVLLEGSCRAGAPRCPTKFQFDAGGGHNVYDVDTTAAVNRFYEGHPDQKTEGWDEVVFFTTFLTTQLGGAYYFPLKNDVTGITKTYLQERGGETYDFNQLAGTGSAGFLKGTVLMSEWHKCLGARLTHAYPCDNSQPFKTDNRSIIGILGQEVGHRWGSFLYFMDRGQRSDDLLGRSLSHWSYYTDSGGSPMEGNHWIPDGASWNLQQDKLSKYGPLDQYVMGLRAPADVPDTLVIQTPQPPACTDDKISENAWDCDGTHPSTPPSEGVKRLSGLGREVKVAEVIASEGPRQPAFPDSPRIVHLAFALVELPDEKATQTELGLLDDLRRAFGRYYYEATDRRMRAITTISRRDDLGLFDFTLDGEGWKAIGGAMAIDTPGTLTLHPITGESGIFHDNLDLDASREKFLTVRMSARGSLSGPMFVSWWNDSETKAPEGRGIELPLHVDGKPRTYVLPMSEVEGWTGRIHGLTWRAGTDVSGDDAGLEFESVETSLAPIVLDQDHDFVGDDSDVCPTIADPDQRDSDRDGIGDACTPKTPEIPKGCGCDAASPTVFALGALLARRRARPRS